MWIQYGKVDNLPLILQAVTGSARRRPRYSISQPIYDGCREGARREEQDRAPVVAGCDPPPILDAGEHVLDLVAQTVSKAVPANCSGAEESLPPPSSIERSAMARLRM